MRLLHLRLKGQMASWCGPALDGRPLGLPIPGASALTGMMGAALGIDRAEHDRLQRLQDAVTHAVVVHAGHELVDFQVADLTTQHMRGPFIGRHGIRIQREGSPDARVKRVIHRPYLSGFDADVMLAVGRGAGITLDEIAHALRRPAWPISLGRRCCPPAVPPLVGIEEHGNLEAAATAVARPGSAIWLPAGPGGSGLTSLPDRRDWRSRGEWRPSLWRQLAA